MRPIRSEDGEGLVDLPESLPNPRAFRRAARPGEGLRACRGLRCSVSDAGTGDVEDFRAGRPASARWSSQTGVGGLKTKMCCLAIEHLEARSLESLRSIQSMNLRVSDDH